MYISNNNASLLSNGNLLIFADHLSNSLKNTYKSYEISPFEKGLSIKITKEGNKLSAKHTDGINLINFAHNNNPKLIIHQFLKGVPEDIIKKVGNYLYAQAPMLQICAQFKSAQDLLVSNPNLLWLISDEYHVDDLKHEEIKSLLSKKQKSIIKYLLPENEESNQYANFISKILLHQGCSKEFAIIESALTELRFSTIRKFNHWPQIPISILEAIIDRPELVNNRLIQSLARKHTAFKNALLSDKMWELSILFRDIILLGELIEINNLKFIIENIRTEKQLNSLHDKWLERSLSIDQLKDKGQYFPSPPIEANNKIIPLTTEQALFTEGKELHHCVHTYTDMVIDGSCYIYKMLTPQRCTIELMIFDNKLTLGQVSRHCNEEVSAPTKQIIQKWVDSGSSAWLKRAA